MRNRPPGPPKRKWCAKGCWAAAATPGVRWRRLVGRQVGDRDRGGARAAGSHGLVDVACVVKLKLTAPLEEMGDFEGDALEAALLDQFPQPGRGDQQPLGAEDALSRTNVLGRGSDVPSGEVPRGGSITPRAASIRLCGPRGSGIRYADQPSAFRGPFAATTRSTGSLVRSGLPNPPRGSPCSFATDAGGGCSQSNSLNGACPARVGGAIPTGGAVTARAYHPSTALSGWLARRIGWNSAPRSRWALNTRANASEAITSPAMVLARARFPAGAGGSKAG